VSTILAIIAGLLVTYALLVIALRIARPQRATLGEALRLLPDLLRLVRRLAGDRTVPRGVRVRLWLLLAYLAIIVAFVLRSVVRRAGSDALARHWPGTPDGLRAVRQLTGLAG